MLCLDFLKIDSNEDRRFIEKKFHLDSLLDNIHYPPTILFDFMSTQIKKEFKNYFDTIAPLIKNHPDLMIEIIARCSCREVKTDKRISKKRGKSVKKYLKKQGIKGRFLIITDVRDQQPLNLCDCSKEQRECSEEKMAQNRNVSLMWLEKSGWLWFRKK